MPRHATRTSFQPGRSGNPRGRTPGTLRKRTIEVRDICSRIIDDPEYRDALRRRMLAGTAGSMEPIIWAYALGRPVARVELGAAGAFNDVSDDELRTRIQAALDGHAQKTRSA